MARSGREGSRRLGTVGRWVAASAALVLGATFVPNLAGASHADVFELDGNMVDNPAGSPFDWTTFFDAAGTRITPLPASFVDSGFDADHAFPDTSTFTGGSKDTLDVSGWSCTGSNNLGGKFDIVNAYSTIYEVPANTGTFSAGDQLLFFGIERAATEGDGAMGFWFLKDGSVDCEKTSGGKAPAFTGNHVDGDIFVAAGFSNGGTEASVTAYEWKGGSDGFLDVDNPLVSGALCAPSGSHNACGIVNTAEIATGADKPWASPDKNGGALDVNAFYEGFVRVPVAEISGCFATFVANTRSSTSPTSTIHDFSRGSFPTCRPSTTMTGLATPTLTSPEMVVGGASNPDTVTYTFRETNDGNIELTNVFVVTDNATCNSTLSPASVATLAKGATATFTCTVSALATAGTTTIRAVGHGTSPFGDVTVCGAAGLPPNPDPATTVCDPDEQDSARSVTIIPGTNLTVSRSPAVVKQGDAVTYTITETNDGTAPAGFDASLALDDVAVTATAGAGATVDQVTDCNTGLAAAPTKAGGDQDAQLEKGETWTYTCTVNAPATSFTLDFTGTGTVLKGTGRARVVTWSTPCTNTPGAPGTAGLYCDADEQKSASVTVIAPSTRLDVTASAVVTYTFVETNDGDAALTPPTPGARESLITFETGQLCDNTALAYVSGDAGNDLVLSPFEAWTFQCKGNVAGPSPDDNSNTSTSSTLAAVGHGCDPTGSDVTAAATSSCSGSRFLDSDERDRVKVSIEYFARGPDA
ncbi:MAG: DUF7507 domain-containing protein [Acidimicrobiales bacterium]